MTVNIYIYTHYFVFVFADFIVDMLAVLCSYSITVREFGSLFAFLKAQDGQWVSSPLLIGTIYLYYLSLIHCYLVFCMQLYIKQL